MLSNVRDWLSFTHDVEQAATPEESIRLMLTTIAQEIESELESGGPVFSNLTLFAEGLRVFSDDLVRAATQKKRDVIEMPNQS